MIVEIVNNGLVINGTPKGRVNLLALKNRAIEVRVLQSYPLLRGPPITRFLRARFFISTF